MLSWRMELHQSHFGMLAGKLTRLDATHLMLIVPKIELFELWLQPRATATIK